MHTYNLDAVELNDIIIQLIPHTGNHYRLLFYIMLLRICSSFIPSCIPDKNFIIYIEILIDVYYNKTII